MAASNGTVVLTGKDGSGNARTINIDAYIPDATGTYITFNPTGLASSTSPSSLVIPVNGYLVDFVTVAAPTAVGFNVILDNAVQNGAALRHNNLLASLVTRQTIRIPVRKGQILQLLQF